MELPALPDRFRLLDQLGLGAQKVVWRARDELLRRDVAIAAFLPGTAGASEALAEARRMARVSDQDRIVTIHDVLAIGARIVLVMQYLPGGDLKSRLPGPEQPSWAMRRKWAIQICSGVRHLHESGFVHGDLKPANVLLDSANNACIADFGLSRVIGNEPIADEVAGTPMYMAPELFAGAAPSLSSDIYSLGCVLYEILCLRPCFSGGDMQTIAAAHSSSLPERPAKADSRISPAVSDCIMAMLSKRSNERPTDLDDVARALMTMPENVQVPDAVTPTASPERLFGRQMELRRVRKLLAEAAAGAPRILLITGEPGIGKSALIEASQRIAEDRGFLTLASRAHENASRTHAAIRDALRGKVSTLAAFTNADLLESFIRADAEATPQGIAPATAALLALETYIEQNPIALFVDDFQWADPLSLAFVEELIASSAASRSRSKICVFVGIRWGEDTSRAMHWVEKMLRDGTDDIQRLHLRGLSEFAIAGLIRSHSEKSLSERNLTDLARLSEGNPLFLLQHLRSDSVSEAVPNVLEELLRARLTTLPDNVRRLATTVALADGPVPADLLLNVSNESEPALWEMLSQAEDAGIVRMSEEAIEVSHPLFRSMLLNQLGGISQQRLNARFVDALRQGAEDDTDSLFQFVHHLLGSGRFSAPEEVIRFAEMAAIRAFKVGDLHRALDYANAVIDQGTGLPAARIGHLNYIAAMGYRTANELDNAESCFQRATEFFREAGEMEELVTTLHYQLATLSQGTFGAIDTQPLEALMPALALENRPAWSRCALALADIRLDQLRPTDALKLTKEIEESGQLPEDQVFLSTLNNVCAAAHEQLLQFDKARHSFSLGLEHAKQSGRIDRVAESLCQMPRPMLFQGRFEEVIATANEVRSLTQRTRNQRQYLRAASCQASVLMAKGQLHEAETLLDELQEFLRRTRFEQLAGDIIFPLAQIAFIRHDYERALDLIGELTRAPGPLVSIGSLYAAWVRRSAIMETDGPNLRHPRSVRWNRVDPYGMNRICLNVLLWQSQNETDFLSESVFWIKHAELSGQRWTTNWLFCLPHVRARGLVSLGRFEEAIDLLENTRRLINHEGAELEAIDMMATTATALQGIEEYVAASEMLAEHEERKAELIRREYP